MMYWFKIAQFIFGVLLVLAILMQNRGAGLGGVFGGSGGVYLSKRGLEKKLFIATIVISILFFATSLAIIIF
ncbi:preprotein translocase subunit SecG [Candidatus Falkowbacteria bacterium CG_4_10_14_0_2_um_filter_41_15]|uniref:Protein-export membrane protein SecG n=3 Tax=Candidatus Falkowiibacteriota TaxID=1752728 RepID=A0A1J4TBB7_9BACT|nr:MAG: preprotein translocase subunit SecG [Candidatus Falkowbacteria bacterium CG1_02_41_21]PIZ09836.1 MAG: preprotein translocase subunit SecG [Candidatus Falkowbacteria bacterium CG_4_10_14_0_8_um_filter_41_36]PJA09919.1 MAG: preprotein translocase subunit SecG [Candidatus Falkowbacteria bacterium CG_4_10_14_0_2_um_filter_41_15]